MSILSKHGMAYGEGVGSGGTTLQFTALFRSEQQLHGKCAATKDHVMLIL